MGLRKKNLSQFDEFSEGWFDLLLPLLIVGLFLAFIQWQKSKQENPSHWVAESRKLIRTGQYQAALEYTNKLLKAFPKNYVHLDQAARIYQKLGDYPKEAAMLEKFIPVASDPSEACPRISQAYRAMGEKKAMLRAAQSCLSLNPGNSDFLFEMALSYERFGDYDKALKTYLEGKNLFTNYLDFKIGYARVLEVQGKSEKAWSEISEVLVKSSVNEDAQIVAVKSLISLKNKTEAEKILNKALSDHPDSEELKHLKERFK